MLRYISSAVILTILMVIFLGRCHYSNMTVGVMGPAYDAASSIGYVKQQIDRYYYDHQKLPTSNAELRQPAPTQFSRRSPLLKAVEVLPGGILFARFTAENKGRNVELVYTPSRDGKYRLNWTCTSYNLTQPLRDALADSCSDSDTPFDRERFAREEALARSADEYLEQVTSTQRQKTAPEPETFDCGALEESADDFLQISADTVTYWSLKSTPKARFSFPRPDDSRATTHWALNGHGYLYHGNRLALFDAQTPAGKPSRVNLLQPNRFRRQGDLLLADSGVGITRIDLCQPVPQVKDTYLMELGAYNQIQDFTLHNGLAYLTALEANRARSGSALQIVSLRSNRPLGFLKLEGKSRGIALSGRTAYVANGARGISIVDVFDPTIPRLLQRVSTMDFASDLMVRGDYLLVADRLAGLRLYQRVGDTVVEIQSVSTEEAAIQLRALSDDYIGVSFKDGSSGLYRWQNNKVSPVALNQ